MLCKIWRVFAGWATLAAVFLFSTAAHAGIIRGSWDPNWGPSYPDTRFDGFVEFFVPNACLPTGGVIGYIADGDVCSSGGMYLVKASATLYDNRGTVPLGDDIPLSTIDFASPVPSPDPVLGVFVDWNGSNLLAAELRTDLIGPQSSGVASSFAPANLFLRFSWGKAGPGGETLDAGAYLLGCDTLVGNACGDNAKLSNRANVTYTTVPEPGSLFLLVSAIVAGSLVRRRVAAA